MEHSNPHRTRSTVTLTIALLFAAATTSAQVSTDAATGQTTPATAAAQSVTTTETNRANTEPAKAEPETICRDVRSTGSRLRKERVCTTRSTSRDVKDWLKRQQERGATDNAGVNGGG
ncbi:MAG: hypothetical protein EBU76_04470 [Gammaproteobacteria bacterium]|jgi:hypothetical protein|nr:hypothetical protein [Actinomycetota bacterium]NBP07725.1 hypothetical protein [Gammaproteobacteria bacterium]